MTSSLNLEPWMIGLLVAAAVAAWCGLFFGIVWLGHAMSGWGRLVKLYPDRSADDFGESPLMTLRWVSGRVGMASNYQNLLILQARRSGLRVSMLAPFGAISRPFLVPWAQIDAVPAEGEFWSGTRLEFGKPPAGGIVIFGDAWNRIAEAGGHRTPYRQPIVEED